MTLAAAALVLIGLGAAPAPGGPSQWRAPPQCPSQAQVDTWVAAFMLDGDAVVPAWQGEIEAQAGGGFTLQLTVRDQSRVLADANCEQLSMAAALVVAVATDPVAVAGAWSGPTSAPDPQASPGPEPEPGPEPQMETSPDPDARPQRIREPEPARAPERAGRRRPWGLVGAAVGAELAVLPRPGVAGAAGGGLGWTHARMELLGLFSNPRAIEGEQPGLGARAMVFSGQVRGCGVLVSFTRRFEVPLCAAMEVGGMWARGYGPGIEPLPKTQAWAALVPSVGITGWLSRRVGIEARVSAPIGLYQPGVHIAEGGNVSVFRVGAVGARAWLGPVLRFR